MLSAGKGKNAVREFLESHRMGHLLQHEDLHKTLEHLSPPLPGMKKTSISMAVSKFTKQLHNAQIGKLDRSMLSSATLRASGPRAGPTQSPRLEKSPSARLRCGSSFTSVTGTWGPAAGAKAVSLLNQKASARADAAGGITQSRNHKKIEAVVARTTGKCANARLQTGCTEGGSQRIRAWACEDGASAGLRRHPADTAAEIETHALVVGVGKVSFARDRGAQQHSSQSGPRALRERCAWPEVLDEYPSAMEAIPCERSPVRAGQPDTQEGIHCDTKDVPQAGEEEAQHGASHRPKEAVGAHHVSRTQYDVEADWDAPEEEIISGFLEKV